VAAAELRHRSWSDEWKKTKAFLEDHNATSVLIDDPRFETSIRQPFKAIGEWIDRMAGPGDI
jgi:hypothetical protein